MSLLVRKTLVVVILVVLVLAVVLILILAVLVLLILVVLILAVLAILRIACAVVVLIVVHFFPHILPPSAALLPESPSPCDSGKRGLRGSGKRKSQAVPYFQLQQ